MARRIKHETLVASTVTTVTLTGSDYPRVQVTNVSGAAAIYFCVNGLGGPSADGVPTVAGDDCFVAAGAAGAEVTVSSGKVDSDDADTVVKLISSGTPTVAVEGVS
ncbi:MAG: hypothetical protein ACRDUY_08095 [Nitriliruptorales bacterium]